MKADKVIETLENISKKEKNANSKEALEAAIRAVKVPERVSESIRKSPAGYYSKNQVIILLRKMTETIEREE